MADHDAEYWRLVNDFVQKQLSHERNTGDRALRHAASEADVALWNHIEATGMNRQAASMSVRGSLDSVRRWGGEIALIPTSAVRRQ